LQQPLQEVYINRLGINSIEFKEEELKLPLAPGEENSFELRIKNYGTPSHIHLSTSKELKGCISFLRDNPYVLQEEYISAIAHIPAEGQGFTEGKIYITTGYGSSKKGFSFGLGKAIKREETPCLNKESLQAQETLEAKSCSLRADSSGKAESLEAEEKGSSGLLTSILKKLPSGFSAQPSRKSSRNVNSNPLYFRNRPQKTFGSSRKNFSKRAGSKEKMGLRLAFGGFIGLLLLFGLGSYLSENSQYAISFPQTFIFSILFVLCTTYILITVMEVS